MTLAGRLSLFFLTALAFVLLGFSGALYGLARSHLLHQLEERSTAALDTLSAVVEIEPAGLEWEGDEHHLPLDRSGAGEALAWAVLDDKGDLVAGSRELSRLLGPSLLLDGTGLANPVAWQGADWQIARRILRADASSGRPGAALPSGKEPNKPRYRVLVLLAGVPLGPVSSTLRTLALLLIGLSLAMWITAAVGGRWLCRRALAPLATMARTAHSITTADLSRRLPGPATGDELEDLCQAFNDLLTRIQVSFEQQQRFTGEASHQLRTPLAAILGQIEVVLRRERPADEYRRVFGAVQKQAIQMRRVVEMLLFLARAEAEARLPEVEDLDLGAWLSAHLRAWEQHPRRTDICWEPDAKEPLLVNAHAELLGQAVDNLLDNACKYSTPGSAIVLSGTRQGEQICLSVTDHGFGIAPEELPHVFQPFFRGPEARLRGLAGSGLGLAIASRIITALGGRIEVESAPGKGSRFVIRLPACPAVDAAV